MPLLIGGHGKRVVGIAARHADIFQFTGLTHGEGGEPSAGGFGIDDVRLRSRWLEEAAGDRLADIEWSALVQLVDSALTPAIEWLRPPSSSRSLPIKSTHTPFLLIGSVEQIVDKLERLRDDVGISHYVIRDAESFAPVVAALAGR